jgi:segregation and condensation protein A
MRVAELELDLEAFEGPLDLLLTLVLREELELADVDVSGIVLTFLRVLEQRAELDLDACGEFLVLVASLLELKARLLFGEEAGELEELDPQLAAEELARRLEQYRRVREAASWLSERLRQERDRFFRVGPAPLAPPPRRELPHQDAADLARALRSLAAEPAELSIAHLPLRYPPVAQFLERFRALLARRRRLDFEQELAGLSRVEQAVAFLALLELVRLDEARVEQTAPFAPIRVERRQEEASGEERRDSWTHARSA